MLLLSDYDVIDIVDDDVVIIVVIAVGDTVVVEWQQQFRH